MNFQNNNVEKTPPAKNISSFTVSFLAEVLGVEEWFDVSEGSIDLGPPTQGFKVTYSVCPGHHTDLDVVIWPQVAKIFCESSFGWVRTWLHLGRRWLAFSVRHALRVNVYDLRDHVLETSVREGLVAVGAEARSNKTTSVYLPKILLGKRRQFAKVIESYQEYYSLDRYFRNLLWNLVVYHIPSCHLDGKFDIPNEVIDVRHQDSILRAVDLETFRLSKPGNGSSPKSLSNANIKVKKKASKTSQHKVKGGMKNITNGIKITGDKMISGVGYVVSSESERGAEQPPVAVVAMFLSSQNLPPSEMHPVFFVNIHKLYDLPEDTLFRSGFNQVYTRWKIPEEEHSSQLCPVSRNIYLRDPRAVPLAPHIASELVTSFQDSLLEIEIRGLQIPPTPITSPALFGKTKEDRDFGLGKRAKIKYKEHDHLIATCQVNLKTLIHGNTSVRGSFPVLPPKAQYPKIISTATILEATPTLTLSIGFVGCRPVPIAVSFSRLLCAPIDMAVANLVLEEIFKLNEGMSSDNELLTGWAVDLGTSIIIFVEGSKSEVQKVYWKTLTYQTTNTSYSSDVWYSTRLYADFMEMNVRFLILNITISLKAILTSPKFFNPIVHPVRDVIDIYVSSLYISRKTSNAGHEPPLYISTTIVPNLCQIFLKIFSKLQNKTKYVYAVLKVLQKLGRLDICGVDEMWSAQYLPTALELRTLEKKLADPTFLKLFE